MTDLERYADRAMFEAAPMESQEPQVHLLWMTPDPLGAIAAACRMYVGKPTYSLSDITDAERLEYLEQVQKTHLRAPLEFVKLHFFIEGVDRAFTHQMVRQRTAVFAQESLRFAVKHNMASESLVPPSIVAGSKSVQETFQNTLQAIEDAYNNLVGNGIPAEDARALLPHCVATRLNYCTDLRNLVDHAGNRLCTQAQFIWRKVFNEIVRAIAEHPDEKVLAVDAGHPDAQYHSGGWYLANTNMFRPVCYQLGHCPFTASFDRGCTIRDRVQSFHEDGISSEQWGARYISAKGVTFENPYPILPAEWMLNERAAWVR